MTKKTRIIELDELTILITMMVDFYEKTVGRQLNLSHIERKTGLSKKTMSPWFKYKAFPAEETFDRFLTFFKDHPDRRVVLKEQWHVAKRSYDRLRASDGAAWQEDEAQQQPPIATTRRLIVGAAASLAGIAVAIAGSSRDTGDTTAPRPARRCAWVAADISPVFQNIGDAEALKNKAKGDRVRLLDLSEETGGTGIFVAVFLPDPRDSATGIGWMRKDDLIPASCDGLA